MWPRKKNPFPNLARSDLHGPGVLNRFRKWMQSRHLVLDVGGPVTNDTLRTISELQKKFGTQLPAPKHAPKKNSKVVSIHSARTGQGQEKAMPQMTLPADTQEHLDRASAAFWSKLVDDCLPSSTKADTPSTNDVLDIDLPLIFNPIPEPKKTTSPPTHGLGINPAAWDALAEEFDKPIEPQKPLSKNISGLFNHMATPVKRLGVGLVATAKQAGKTTKTALGLGPVTEHEIHDAQVKVVGALADMAIGVGTTKVGALIAGIALGATAAPTVALLAGTALTTGVIRLGINCARDYHMKPQIGWKGLLKKNFKRAVFGAGFGLIGVGIAEGISLADQALSDYPPTLTPEPAPKPFVIPEAANEPVSATASAPIGNNVVLPAEAPPTTQAVVNDPVPAPTMAVSEPPVTTTNTVAEKAAAREAWINAQNAETDKLNRETRYDIQETVERIAAPQGTTEMDPPPSKETPATDPLDLKNCQATGRTEDGGYLLECDHNPALKTGMTGTLQISM